jgi:hypothetical protein
MITSFISEELTFRCEVPQKLWVIGYYGQMWEDDGNMEGCSN